MSASEDADATGASTLRIDKFLWFARLAKSRSEAKAIAEARHLRIDGRVVDRASASVRQGSVIAYPRGGRVHVLRVERLPERRGPFTIASQCYTDLSEH